MHESRILGWQALVKESVPFYKTNVWYLVALSILMGLLGALPLVLVLVVYAVITFVLASSGAGSEALGTVMNIVLGVLGIAAVLWLIFVSGAAQIATVRASFDGKAVPLGTLIRGSLDVNRAARVFGAMVLYGLLVLVGFVFLVIPGIYLVVRGVYLPYALVREDLGVFDAIRRSWALTKGFWWVTALRLGWFALAAGAGSAIIAILAAAPSMGPVSSLLDMAWQMLVVSPFAIVFSRRLYEQVRDAKAKDAESFHPMSSSEKWQVAGVIVLFLILGSLQSSMAPKQTVGNDELDEIFEELDLN